MPFLMLYNPDSVSTAVWKLSVLLILMTILEYFLNSFKNVNLTKNIIFPDYWGKSTESKSINIIMCVEKLF